MRQSRWKLLLGAAAFTATVGLAAPPVWAIDGGTMFELDGDAANNTPNPPGDDWEDVEDGSSNANVVTNGDSGGIIFDTFNPINTDLVFTGGATKDDLPISGWEFKTAKPTPDKDNITNGYAAAYTCTAAADANDECDQGDTVVYFGADRFANNGSADIGIWFFQQNVEPEPGSAGGFTNEHVDGDTLILANFDRGGVVASIEVYEWCLGCGNDGNVNLVNVTTTLNVGECGSAVSPLDACAISNTGGQGSFWPYDPKFGSSGVFPLNSLFEGGIDLSDLFGDDVPCFASFLVETRSSTSVDAVLKDFVGGRFSLCSINGSKACLLPVYTCENDGETSCEPDNAEACGNVPEDCLPDIEIENAQIDDDEVSVLSTHIATITNTGPAPVFDAAIRENYLYVDICDTMPDSLQCDFADNDGVERCDIVSVNGAAVTPKYLTSGAYVSVPSGGGYSVASGLASGNSLEVEILCDTFADPMTNSADYAAKSDDSLADYNVFTTDDGPFTSSCPSPDATGEIVVTKECSVVELVADQGALLVQVVIDNITVENKSDFTVVGLDITDNKICASGENCIASDQTLMPLQTKIYKTDAGAGVIQSDTPLIYVPVAPDGVDPGDVEDGDVFNAQSAIFSDTATATGQLLFNGFAVSDTGTANCNLCPAGEICTLQTCSELHPEECVIPENN